MHNQNPWFLGGVDFCFLSEAVLLHPRYKACLSAREPAAKRFVPASASPHADHEHTGCRPHRAGYTHLNSSIRPCGYYSAVGKGRHASAASFVFFYYGKSSEILLEDPQEPL